MSGFNEDNTIEMMIIESLKKMDGIILKMNI